MPLRRAGGMVDAWDLKSLGPMARAGSTPALGTTDFYKQRPEGAKPLRASGSSGVRSLAPPIIPDFRFLLLGAPASSRLCCGMWATMVSFLPEDEDIS